MSTVLEQKRQSLLEKSRSLSIDIPLGELLPKSNGSAGERASEYVRAYNEFSDAGTYVGVYSAQLAHTVSKVFRPPFRPWLAAPTFSFLRTTLTLANSP